MKTKAAKIFSSIKYELCIFVVLAVQAIMNMYPYFGVGEFTRLYYLIDFSMGKTSRLLVGSIVKLFNSDPSPEWIAGFSIVVLFAVLLLSSIVIGKVVKATAEENKNSVLVFVAFFVTGIFTFSGFSNYLGVLDIWMFLVAMLAVVCAGNKYLCWAVPVLCAVGVMIHNAFVLSYFPVIALFVFYYMVTKKNKAGNIIVFVLSLFVTFGLTVYITLKGAQNVTVTYDQLFEMLSNRGGYNYESYGIEGIAFYLLDIPPSYTGYTAEMVAQASLTERIAMMASQSLSGISLGYTIAVCFAGCAIIGAFWAIWIKCIANTDSKIKKFVYLCFMLSVFTIPVSMLVAFDFIRWFQASIISQFMFALLMFAAKDEAFAKATDRIKEYFSDKKLLLAIVFVVYATLQSHGLSA